MITSTSLSAFSTVNNEAYDNALDFTRALNEANVKLRSPKPLIPIQASCQILTLVGSLGL